MATAATATAVIVVVVFLKIKISTTTATERVIIENLEKKATDLIKMNNYKRAKDDDGEKSSRQIHITTASLAICWSFSDFHHLIYIINQWKFFH